MELKKKSTTKEELKLEIGRRIREQRKANGFKTKKTYEDLGIARTTYTGYEMGSRTPDPELMNKIATYLNTTVSYLMCETDDPEIQKSATSSFEEILEDRSLTIGGKPLSEEQWSALYNTLKDINEQNKKNTKH